MSHHPPISGDDFKESLEDSEFNRLFVEHQAAIYSHIFTLLPQPEDAADVFQDTCLALLRKSDQFTPGTNFRAWACQVAKYEVLNFRRHAARSKWLSFDQEMIEKLGAEDLAYNDNLAERRGAMRHCVKKLNPNDRGLITARYQKPTTATALAQQMGRSARSVQNSLQRIHVALRECVERELAAKERSS